jgi:hypothetical protein
MNSYLVTFDESLIARNDFVAALNEIGGVVNWLAFMPSAICVISPYSAHEISVALRMKRPGIRFLVTQLQPYQTDGWLEQGIWEFMQNPRPVALPVQKKSA